MSADAAKTQRDLASFRDIVESIWIAIVLAFVLRAFMVEAFVIPTGSMAAGLMGEHWDLTCPSCGIAYPMGWNRQDRLPDRGQVYTPDYAVCPNCSFPFKSAGLSSRRVNGGDRVLVLKYVYDFREPRRFDVVVFRNPQSNNDNYIKRLVGLPGEAVQLVHGDVYVADGKRYDKAVAYYAAAEAGSNIMPPWKDPTLWRIARKPSWAQDRMWHVICDVDYQPTPEWLADPECRAPRWRPRGGAAWTAQRDGRVWAFDGTERSHLWLETRREDFLPEYGYNDKSPSRPGLTGTEVTDDVRISAVIYPAAGDSKLTFRLRGLVWQFEAVVETAGRVQIRRARRPRLQRDAENRTVESDARPDWKDLGAVTVDPIPVGRGTRVSFTHADAAASVSVGGHEVLRAEYDGEFEEMIGRWQRHEDHAGGMEQFPETTVALAGDGGAFELRHLRVCKDTFYTGQNLWDVKERDGAVAFDYIRRLRQLADKRKQRVMGVNPSVIRDSRGWGTTGRPIRLLKPSGDKDLHSFFMLGDNSPASRDSRMWTMAAPSLRLWRDPGSGDDKRTQPIYQLGTVPRYNIIGRAVFVYWPSGYRFPMLPWLPFVPNVGKMRLIH